MSKQIKFLDSDIAIVEVMRDALLDNNIISKSSKNFKDSFLLTEKIYASIKEDAYIESRTILQEANDIIFDRQEEKQREYGPINESLQDAATVASIISNKKLVTDDVYAVLIALKISRLRWNNKRDTYVDCAGYLAAHEDFHRKKENEIDNAINHIKSFKIKENE